MIAGASAISLSEDTVGTLADYNLCVPASPYQGPHDLSVEPGFVAPGAFCYWLREDSVARGKGVAAFAPTTGPWPDLATGAPAPPVDSDHDGMPDAWEMVYGLDPNDPGDGAATAANGYTNVENYLNGLAGDPIPGE